MPSLHLWKIILRKIIYPYLLTLVFTSGDNTEKTISHNFVCSFQNLYSWRLHINLSIYNVCLVSR